MRARRATSTVVFAATAVPVAETVAAVDFKTLPQMPGAEVRLMETAGLIYTAPGDPTAALAFVTKQLGEQGWRESRTAGPRFVSNVFAAGGYEKSGFTLAFTARQTAGRKGMVTVTLQNMGNLDTRALPRHGVGTLILGGKSSTTYLTSANVRDVAAHTRKALTDLGWIEYAPSGRGGDPSLEHQTLTFEKNGTSLTAFVTVALALKGSTLVQYRTSMLAFEHPAATGRP